MFYEKTKQVGTPAVQETEVRNIGRPTACTQRPLAAAATLFSDAVIWMLWMFDRVIFFFKFFFTVLC